MYIYIYSHIHSVALLREGRDNSYEESTRLAETRLAQNSLDYIEIC